MIKRGGYNNDNDNENENENNENNKKYKNNNSYSLEKFQKCYNDRIELYIKEKLNGQNIDNILKTKLSLLPIEEKKKYI